MDNIKSFVVYNEIIDTADELSDDQLGKLFRMMLHKVNGREYKCEDKLLKLIFIPIDKTLDRERKKYENKIQERSNSGRAGNLKKYYPELYNDFKKGKIDLDEAYELAKTRKVSHSENPVANTAINIHTPLPTNSPNNSNVDVDDNEKLFSLNAAAKVFCNNEKVVQAIYKDKKLKVETQQSLIAKIKDFILHLEQKNISEKTSKDFRDHFISWLRKKEEGKKATTENKIVNGFSSADVEKMKPPRF